MSGERPVLLLQVPVVSWQGRCWLPCAVAPVEPTTRTLSSTPSSTWSRLSPQVKLRLHGLVGKKDLNVFHSFRMTCSTSGGGWQDQVGGLVGGIKVGRSRASLPLRVEVELLRPPEDFLASLEQHLLLVYTGKTRLARNLLQV